MAEGEGGRHLLQRALFHHFALDTMLVALASFKNGQLLLASL